MKRYFKGIALTLLGFMMFMPAIALAGDGDLNGANTAWILTSTALVLFMTIPGLSFFYSGLVRSKNSLSVLMQCFAITCLVSILWMVFLYGLAFGENVELSKVGCDRHGAILNCGESDRASTPWVV